MQWSGGAGQSKKRQGLGVLYHTNMILLELVEEAFDIMRSIVLSVDLFSNDVLIASQLCCVHVRGTGNALDSAGCEVLRLRS